MLEGKKYKLFGAEGIVYESEMPGEYGGNRETGVYGRMDCSAALNALKRPDRDHYIQNRVFFKDEATDLAAGFRPCGRCLREKYKQYMADPQTYKAQFGIE